MSGKLTSTKGITQEKLTSRVNMPFVISFKYELQKGYKLSDMEKIDIKEFQSFLDRVSQMTFQEVDKLYRRKSDKSDVYNGQDVVHYGYSDGCRIHGVIENQRFKIIRIDPNHKVHD